MNIEVNRDLDRFKESVILGLSLKQLIYSAIALAAGAGIVLLVYPYVGLTMAAYIAVPVVAPIALTGFYSFHGMTFVETQALNPPTTKPAFFAASIIPATRERVPLRFGTLSSRSRSMRTGSL